MKQSIICCLLLLLTPFLIFIVGCSSNNVVTSTPIENSDYTFTYVPTTVILQTQSTSSALTPKPIINQVMSNETVINYLATGKNSELYTILEENIFDMHFYTYKGNEDWWNGVIPIPIDYGYMSLGLYVDKGSPSPLLPPDSDYDTLPQTLLKGRTLFFFTWLVKPNGIVIPKNSGSEWLKEQLLIPYPVPVQNIDPTQKTTTILNPLYNTTSIFVRYLMMRWEEIPEALYNIDISTDSSYQSIIDYERNLPTSYYYPSNLEGYSTYYWRVQVVIQNKASNWVNGSFTTRKLGE